MKACGFPLQWLSSYCDGEAGARTEEVEKHVQTCTHCRQMLMAWRSQGDELGCWTDVGVGDLGAATAQRKIHAAIEARRQRSLVGRCQSWFHDLLLMHRRAVIGVVAAAGLGAVSAPFVVLWAGKHMTTNSHAAKFAGVVIESLEWHGRTQAVVYESGAGSTTLIWVEPDGHRGETDSETVGQ